jgi:choline-sulfatase
VIAPRISTLLVLTLLVLGCESRPHAKNVVFILVDTLRADHLGVYGYGRDTSPTLDAFARQGVLFQSARSQASCTYPSVNSMITGRYPAVFLAQPDGYLGIPEWIPSLAEILKQNGYRTAAVSASAVVRNTPSQFNPGGGFGRGFDVFQEDCVWKNAACVNEQAFEQLRADDSKPFFLYLHYLEPHGPYHPPADFQRRFATGPTPEKAFIRNGNPNPIADFLYKKEPDPGVTPADLQYLKNLYDDEIAYFDTQLARLLDELRTRGLLDDTLVVFSADHGEEFLEHGHIKHCRTVYDTLVKVPLVLHIPGAEPRAVPQAVENVDIVPTVLDYLGVTPPKGVTFEGRSLRPLIEGTAAESRLQFSLAGPWRGSADGRYKLIHNLSEGSYALYDLQADPGETADILARHRRDFHKLREALTAWLARTEGTGAADESLRKAQEAEKRLRSLGYLE